MSLVIIGSGGHAGMVIEAIHAQNRKSEISGLLDDFLIPGLSRHGCTILGKIDDIPKLDDSHYYFIAVGDIEGRSKIWDRMSVLLGESEKEMAQVAHPSACWCNCKIHPGVFLGPGAIVNNNATVFQGAIVNTRANLGHDSTLGAFSHLAPSSATGGHVTIGHHTMIGMGAMIRDHISVGNNCVIGMGSIVTKPVPDNVIGWGNPFRIHANRPV